MAQQPTGTVTFLFTDIEGSTQRWEQQPQAMQHALAQHDAILRESIERHGGFVFKTVGDAFYAAFALAPDALAAAVSAQRALQRQTWGAAGPLRVRMALHTGGAEQRDGDYFGQPLNRVARLLAAGHGGQVLLSDVTAGLVRYALPAGVSLRDLGEHRLKDLWGRSTSSRSTLNHALVVESGRDFQVKLVSPTNRARQPEYGQSASAQARNGRFVPTVGFARWVA